ncbi:MAG TPA: hypothetical protein VHA33_21505 [Candidatus Angelobacter sp.]|nr:hypothetical protein [Candidatus Angelobacter sp.]
MLSINVLNYFTIASMSEDESFIVKHRNLSDIVHNPDKDALADFFEQPLMVIAESITGWLASGPKEWALATGRIVQGALKVRLFQQVAAEIGEFRRKGKIPEDFAEHEKGFQTWVELFAIIDEETPDEERLDALKAMFFAVNRINVSDADRIQEYQLFQVAKRLGSNDLLVLKRVNELREGTRMGGQMYEEWVKLISANSGNLLHGLIDLAEANLVQHRLLSERFQEGRGRILIDTANFRMTDLGMKFCQNIDRYHVDKKA